MIFLISSLLCLCIFSELLQRFKC